MLHNTSEFGLISKLFLNLYFIPCCRNSLSSHKPVITALTCLWTKPTKCLLPSFGKFLLYSLYFAFSLFLSSLGCRLYSSGWSLNCCFNKNESWIYSPSPVTDTLTHTPTCCSTAHCTPSLITHTSHMHVHMHTHCVHYLDTTGHYPGWACSVRASALSSVETQTWKPSWNHSEWQERSIELDHQTQCLEAMRNDLSQSRVHFKCN